MDKLRAIRVCREVARQGGFAAAGRALKISTPSVSRIVSELEADLGLRLFQRSTRQLNLTEEGESYLGQVNALVDELETISAEMRERRTEAKGHLRISSVVAFGQERVAPAVPKFLSRHPEVTVDLHIGNRKVDLIQEHFDLAIRIGGDAGLSESGLVARKIYAQKLIFAASPDYIADMGEPETLDAIARHRTVKQVSETWGVTHTILIGEERVEFRMPDTFVVNSPNAALNAVRDGLVIGLIADYLVSDMIKRGELRRVLPDHETPDQPIFAVFVHRAYMPAKLRAFLDHLVSVLGNRPDV
ncbi:LysR family transcriptional regulator [Pararhodobacter sp. SW119]|uniref:LysR family transcriptional regulator n=1 Tax=Pararhodobacter sp. SW119 TaxID=2780075 RepID=UPI001AE03EA3|nr:LysR family transcriptional regulator [Pararhodobacter sp. SW119]